MRPQNRPKYTERGLRDAMLEVYERTDVRVMSEELYNELRDDEHPHSDTIRQRLGPWTEVRP